MSTHTKFEGATWPSVWSRHQRMRAISRILQDEGIEVTAPDDPAYIAQALLRHVVDQGLDAGIRIACFKASIELELLDCR